MSVGVLSRAGGGGGAADLSAYRLSGVADDPTVIPRGAFGDELEYSDQTTFAAAWAVGSGTSARVLGSAIDLWTLGASGRGILFPVAGFASDWEVAYLFQSSHYGFGPCVVNASGNGMGIFRDGPSGTIYLGALTALGYSGDLATVSGAVSGFGAGVDPVWIAIRKLGNVYRWRASADGVTWVTLFSRTDAGLTPDRVGVNANYNPLPGLAILHRMAYGAPDLAIP